MFMDWKNQHCGNEYITQSNFQSQCNPYRIANGIFHITRTKNFRISVDTQKTEGNLAAIRSANKK